MSALQLPPGQAHPAAPTSSAAPAPSGGRRRHLRVVEAPPSRSLAPSGPLQAWRRRLGVLAMVLGLLVLAGQALTGSPAVAPATVPVDAATVVVEPGQTLWDVATEHAPADTAPDDFVRQLAEVNGITNGAVDAWQVLRLPVG